MRESKRERERPREREREIIEGGFSRVTFFCEDKNKESFCSMMCANLLYNDEVTVL